MSDPLPPDTPTPELDPTLTDERVRLIAQCADEGLGDDWEEDDACRNIRELAGEVLALRARLQQVEQERPICGVCECNHHRTVIGLRDGVCGDCYGQVVQNLDTAEREAETAEQERDTLRQERGALVTDYKELLTQLADAKIAIATAQRRVEELEADLAEMKGIAAGLNDVLHGRTKTLAQIDAEIGRKR